MTETHCFVTKKNLVTDHEVDQIEVEFKNHSIKVIEKNRLGSDGLILKIENFNETNFTHVENKLSLDLNFSKEEVRLRKLLLADMDSTIISVECIDELADFCGLREEVASITEKSMDGMIDFRESLVERVKLLRGLSDTKLLQCFEERISLNSGAITLVRTMKKMNSNAFIISGGFTFFADKVASRVGFDKAFANKLVYDGNFLSGIVEEPILDRSEKYNILTKLCKEKSIKKSDVIAVGDGANDVEMITTAGLGVSYYGKPILTDVADFKIYHSDLRALLYFQGIRESDFFVG